MQIVISILVIVAALLVVATAVALWRAPDALTRVNVLGPTVSLAVPLLILAVVLNDVTSGGLRPNEWIRAVLAVCGVWFIGAIGSFYIGRSIYGVTVRDPGSEA
ncbi:hypothetical membrane protein [Corynebacterium renale]|uniref:Na+/H+ antiporter subunit G n=1 Tax=Corynebacterium renale TaxID=1724 RepID=UPI000DA2DE5C|nr:Na+/H+ antiporter subunit G [Corynebacterium renale]SQG63834.1 hypothetical membrane protein [Corynebacterium renale]STD02361.1 hypothetical membrane protein [Corynebacterium renale]